MVKTNSVKNMSFPLVPREASFSTEVKHNIRELLVLENDGSYVLPKSLHVTDCMIDELLTSGIRISRSEASFSGVSSKALFEFANVFGKHLTTFSLMNNVSVNDDMFLNLLREMPNLESLVVCMETISSGALSQIAQNCPCLQRLTLYSVSGIDDGFIQSLKTIHLEKLKLFPTYNLKKPFKIDHEEEFPLESLTLVGSQITDTVVAQVQALKHPTSISLRTTSVSTEALKSLLTKHSQSLRKLKIVSMYPMDLLPQDPSSYTIKVENQRKKVTIRFFPV